MDGMKYGYARTSTDEQGDYTSQPCGTHRDTAHHSGIALASRRVRHVDSSPSRVLYHEDSSS